MDIKWGARESAWHKKSSSFFPSFSSTTRFFLVQFSTKLQCGTHKRTKFRKEWKREREKKFYCIEQLHIADEKLWKIYDENSYSWTAAPHKVSALLETNEKKFFSHSCMASIFKQPPLSHSFIYSNEMREGKREFFADLNKAKNQQHHSDVALQKGREWEKLCLHWTILQRHTPGSYAHTMVEYVGYE
jgi:hypothetical protein